MMRNEIMMVTVRNWMENQQMEELVLNLGQSSRAIKKIQAPPTTIWRKKRSNIM